MKLINTFVGAAVAAALLSACGTSHLSKDITPEGWVNGEIVFPEDSSAILKEGVFPNPASLKLLAAGVTKHQVFDLLGRPHFREGVFAVREWDYIFNFRGTEGRSVQCRYKIVFSKDETAQSFFSKPEVCATALEDFEVTPAEVDLLLGAAGGGSAKVGQGLREAAKRLAGLITISGGETPPAVREAAEELVGIITISEGEATPAMREAARELRGVIAISGDDTPSDVREAANKLVGTVTISEVPGWVDVRHATNELADAISASGDDTPSAVREAARKLVGIVTISEVPGWVDVRHATNELAAAISASGDDTPSAVREAARALVGVVTISGGETVPNLRADLSTDTLFGFNSTAVTPAGHATLTSLASRIKQAGLRTHVTVRGHADRLGAAEANQAVSLRRAQAVRDVLVAAGVSDPIQTEGVGSAEPKMQCASNLSHTALLDCLAPNRRVVVTASSN